MTTPFNVGDAVRLKEAVGDGPSGDSPGGTYGLAGDKLIVRHVNDATYQYPIAVSHEDVTDGTCFRVQAGEIEPWVEAPSKEWCANMAKLEGDSEIGAGPMAGVLPPAVEEGHAS